MAPRSAVTILQGVALPLAGVDEEMDKDTLDACGHEVGRR